MIKMRRSVSAFAVNVRKSYLELAEIRSFLMSLLIWNREAVWGFLESRGAENLRLAE